jgi:glycosyltransferase involved in cell wall biosynthesis
MKLVAVTRVKNEIDIIEAFVRHHIQYFDKLIILDDGSTDDTYNVLKSLRAAGLPVVLLRDPVVGYEQGRYMTLLLRMAVYQFGADWVAPIDADEFLEVQGEMTLTEILASQEPSLIGLPWSNFIWKPEHNTSLDLNPVLRMRLRLPPRPDMMKVLVPAKLVNGNVRLVQGNHALMRDEEVLLPGPPLTQVGICHFPIRNLLQYASKVVVGYLQYSATPGWDRNMGFHYIKPFEALLADGLRGIEQRMSMDSCRYSEEVSSSNAREPREKPLRYKGGPLTVTPSLQENFYYNVLRHAETVAQERAVMSRRSEAALRELELSKGAFTNVTQELARSTEDKGLLEARLAKLELEFLHTSREHATMLTSSQQLAENKAALEERVAKLELQLSDTSRERAAMLTSSQQLAENKAALEERVAELELQLSNTSRERAAMLTSSQQLAEDKAAFERRLAKLEIELLGAREVIFVQSERLSSRSYKLLELVYRRLTALGLSPRAFANCAFWLLRIK